MALDGAAGQPTKLPIFLSGSSNAQCRIKIVYSGSGDWKKRQLSFLQENTAHNRNIKNETVAELNYMFPLMILLSKIVCGFMTKNRFVENIESVPFSMLIKDACHLLTFNLRTNEKIDFTQICCRRLLSKTYET